MSLIAHILTRRFVDSSIRYVQSAGVLPYDHRSVANTHTRYAPNKPSHKQIKLSNGRREQKQVLNAVTYTRLLSDYVLDLGKVSYMEAHCVGHKR